MHVEIIKRSKQKSYPLRCFSNWEIMNNTLMAVRKCYLILVILLLTVVLGHAQSSLFFYHTEGHINSSNLNPAFLTSQKERFTFSILPLAGMGVGYNKQEIIQDMLTKFVKGTITDADYNQVFDDLVKTGLFYQRMEISLLNLGYYNSAIGSFNFRIKEAEQFITNLEGNFSNFLSDPDYSTVYTDRRQFFPSEIVHYREYSLGYGKQINNKLEVGIRAKLYFGKASMYSEAEGEALIKDGDYYLNTYGPVRLSVPLDFKLDADTLLDGVAVANNYNVKDYLMNSKNLGLGIDLGFSYRINSRIVVSASVVDLGKINWKSNLNSLILKGQYKFPDEFIFEKGDNYLSKTPNFSTETEDVHGLFKVEKDQEEYSLSLPTTYYAGIRYKLSPIVSLGFVNRLIDYKGLKHNSMSFTSGFDVNKNFNISFGYSIIGDSYFNIPLGFLYKWKHGQTYLGTDNLTSFLLPGISEFSGISFGTSFYLFRERVKYDDVEYLPFYKRLKNRPEDKKGLL